MKILSNDKHKNLLKTIKIKLTFKHENLLKWLTLNQVITPQMKIIPYPIWIFRTGKHKIQYSIHISHLHCSSENTEIHIYLHI